jgi:hypothetical protein
MLLPDCRSSGSLTLSCSVAGSPTPTVAWYKDGYRLAGTQVPGQLQAGWNTGSRKVTGWLEHRYQEGYRLARRQEQGRLQAGWNTGTRKATGWLEHRYQDGNKLARTQVPD